MALCGGTVIALLGVACSSTGSAPGAGAGGMLVSGGQVASSSGGRTGSGGTPASGGSVANGGSVASVGGAGSVGGAVSTGGSVGNGGELGTGGHADTGGIGSIGGSVGTGGKTGSTSGGGAVASGGSTGTGGATGTSKGGASGTGGAAGAPSAGGATNSGGTAGAPPAGGMIGAGGAPSTGGASGVGGSGGSAGGVGGTGSGGMGGTTTTGGTGGQVTTPDVASKVVVFDSGTCALLTTGTVRCWGFNVQGELGSPLANFVLTPTAVEGIGGVGVLSNVTDLAVGVAVSASQVVYWPQQTGTYTYNATPVAVPGITNATAVASADTFLMSGSTACALLADGTVTCWQAGKTPVPVSGLTGAVAIGTGVTHGCALTSSGTVACWGSNVWGELGNGQTSLTTTMTASQVGGLTDILALYVGGGDENACALRADLTVLCWGNDAHWEFGSATAGLPTANPFSPTPVPVNELHGASFVALGTDHSCAIFADGSVQCSTPTAPSLWSTVTGVSNAVALSTCSTMFCGHSCALIADGSIKCWGQDGSGELGDGNYSPTHNSIYESAVTVKGL